MAERARDGMWVGRWYRAVAMGELAGRLRGNERVVSGDVWNLASSVVEP